jgi:hypothetical protein
MYRTTGATNYYDRSSKANSLAHVELFCKDLVNHKVFLKQDSRYKGREQDSASFHIAADLYTSGAKAIGTGEPLRKYMGKARCNWRTLSSMDVDDDGLDGYEFDGADDEEVMDLV